MKLLEKLEKRFGKLAIANLTLIIIFGQVALFALIYSRPNVIRILPLVGEKVMQGEWWRMLTFFFIPPMSHPIFMCFAWYIFYLMGTSLEREWGCFKYNVYVLLSFLFSLLAAIVFPHAQLHGLYASSSIFFAFATLFPNFTLMLFFILPIRIKWLALVTWILLIFGLFSAPAPEKALILCSIANYLIFFGRHISINCKHGQKRMRAQTEAIAASRNPLHVCETCGIDELTDPSQDFRYCSDCEPVTGYCRDHINNHECLKEN